MPEITREWMQSDDERWREVNRVTDELRAAELRAMTDEKCFAAMKDMLWFCAPGLPERGSGLVEFQRILHGRR